MEEKATGSVNKYVGLEMYKKGKTAISTSILNQEEHFLTSKKVKLKIHLSQYVTLKLCDNTLK